LLCTASVSVSEQKGMLMARFGLRIGALRELDAGGVLIAAAFAFLAAFLSAQLASAHLLEGNRGKVDAFNYDLEQVKHLDEDCASAFECRPNDAKSVFFNNCRYDVYSSECQCSEGDFSRCNLSRSSVSGREAAAFRGNDREGLLAAAFGWLGSVPIAFKVAAVALLAVAAIAIVSRHRDNAVNNLRRARMLHEKASRLHDAGKEEQAKALFDRSNYLRERAEGQQKG